MSSMRGLQSMSNGMLLRVAANENTTQDDARHFVLVPSFPKSLKSIRGMRGIISRVATPCPEEPPEPKFSSMSARHSSTSDASCQGLKCLGSVAARFPRRPHASPSREDSPSREASPPSSREASPPSSPPPPRVDRLVPHGAPRQHNATRASSPEHTVEHDQGAVHQVETLRAERLQASGLSPKQGQR